MTLIRKSLSHFTLQTYRRQRLGTTQEFRMHAGLIGNPSFVIRNRSQSRELLPFHRSIRLGEKMEGENINKSGQEKMDASIQLPQVDAINDVLKTKDWLDGQNYDLAVSLRAEKLDLLDTEDVEELQKRIADLQTELSKVSTDGAIKELVSKKAQLNQALCDKMFTTPLPSVGTGTENTDPRVGNEDPDRRIYQALLQEQSNLSSNILRKDEIVTELQKEVDAIKKRNFELKKSNRGLMAAMGQHSQRLEKMAQDVRNNAACRGLKEELESTVSRTEIAKCTLQALIVGSGVNWAQDPELMETVLLCGDTSLP